MNDVLVIGVSPVFGEEGGINQVRVKDSKGEDKFKIGEDGERIYQTQDELSRDNASTIKKKLFSIPSISKTTVMMPMSIYNALPMRPQTKQTFMDKHSGGSAIGDAGAVDFIFGDEGKDLLKTAISVSISPW